jgi:excinuclease UvrABC helicase subunit UvrB
MLVSKAYYNSYKISTNNYKTISANFGRRIRRLFFEIIVTYFMEYFDRSYYKIKGIASFKN